MSIDRYKEMLAELPDIGGRVQHALDSVGNVAIANSDVLTVVMVIAVVSMMLMMSLRVINARKPVDEAEEMRKRLELDAKYADAFGDKLFDMLCNDEIDRHEYKRACRRFGIAYRLSDLLTKKNPKRGLRFRVLNNIRKSHATPSMVGKFPGPHPSTDYPASLLVIKPAVKQRKVWLVAGKALSRRK